jgi:2',3'-cyclic-nucleotide 2'-phosphodiesterase / 3'-nucleotidase
MKKAKRYLLPLIFILSGAFLCAQTVNIKIIETSDVHGALVPYDLTNDLQTNSSLAQVHSYIVSQRIQQDQEVILLDNGDLIQGDPISYFYSFEDSSDTHVFADALNFMGYDAATIGNHDIETGHNVYDKFRREINFPWLAANAINVENDEPYFQPYTIIERKGVLIAVLGLITPSIPNWLPEKLWSGIEFEDMIETAEKWVAFIQEKEKPDLIIGLFHSGVDFTYNEESEDTYKNENASQLIAEQVPGFDVIFVGHDHSGWNFKIENEAGDSVLILGPLSRARTVAVADIQLEFDSISGRWKQKNISGEIVETKNYKPDDHFMSKFLLNLNIVKNYTETPLGQIMASVSSKESLFGPSEFVDLIHTAQLEITEADISFASPLSFNTTIDSGWIRVKDLFKLYHYENYLYTMSLTGEEVDNYLEYSFGSWFNEMKDSSDHLLIYKTNEDGSIKYSQRTGSPELEEIYYNYSSAAGINYTVDVSKPAGDRVNIVELSDGTPFDFDKTFKVAINSYRGSGGGGHLTRGAGISQDDLSERIVASTNRDIRYNLMQWIKEKKNIRPHLLGNWKIIPEEWWQKGKEKDYMLLFGNTSEPKQNNTEEPKR